MITARHHVVSLAAVFLALVIGLVLGSGVFSESLLSGLRTEKQDLHAQNEALRNEQNALGERLGTANGFDAQMAPRIVHGELAGKSVLVFRTPDAHDDDVDALSRIIAQAGGTSAGTITLTQQFVDGNSAEKLRTVVDSGILPAGAQLDTGLVDQGAQAGDLLGIALLINRNPTVPPVDDVQRETVLAALRDTGFLTYPGQRIGAANAAIVVTGGGLAEDAGNVGAGVARFAAALAPHGSGVVLAGRDGCAAGTAAVAVARADNRIAEVINTVDDVDLEAGRITAVLAVANVIRGGHVGQYGVGHGAGAVTLAR